MATISPKKGHLLIAEPSIIGDISFHRAVVLLADETESGFIGFILNKPLEYTLQDLVPQINSTIPVYEGGPVEQDNLYFIHQVPDLIPDSIEIANGIYWGGDFTTVSALLETESIGEKDIRFFLGYSGWDFEQLHQEIQTEVWVVTKNSYKSSLMEKDHATFWKEKMEEFGGDYLIWSNAPENPINN